MNTKRDNEIMEKSCEVKEKPANAREFFKSSYFWKPAIGILLGGVGGYLYYHFVGCTSGTCAITSNMYSSIIFGALMGLLITKSPCVACK